MRHVVLIAALLSSSSPAWAARTRAGDCAEPESAVGALADAVGAAAARDARGQRPSASEPDQGRTTRPAKLAAALCAADEPGAIALDGLAPPPAATGTILIVNKGLATGASFQWLDLATGKVTKTIPVKQKEPHEIAVSPDGRRAVAPDYGAEGQGEEAALDGRTVNVIDLAKRTQKAMRVPGGYARVHGVAWIDDRRFALTADGRGCEAAGRAKPDRGRTDCDDYDSGYLVIVDAKSGRLVQAIRTGEAGTHLVRVMPDGKHLIATNIQGGSLSILDLEDGRVVKTIATGGGAEGVEVTPDGREIWVANQSDESITVIDAQSFRKKTTFAAPGGPIRVHFADGMAITSDRGGNSVSFYDVKTHRRTKKIALPVYDCDDVGGKASSVPMDVLTPPLSPWIYVSNSHSGVITVIDSRDGSIAGFYRAGNKPDPMAFLP